MNDVNKAVARKLRSLAMALSHDSDTGRAGSVGFALQLEVGNLNRRADELDPPKPAIEEPTDWGSVVRARLTGDETSSVLATYVPAPKEIADEGERKFSWYDDNDSWHCWGDFTDPEVLRIGVGEEKSAAWYEGFTAACDEILKELRPIRADAITAERQDGLDRAIAAVERQRSEK